MRRKKSKIKFILIAFLFLILCGVSYSYLETSLQIKGTVISQFNEYGYIIDPKSNPYFNVNSFIVNKWQENNIHKYQFDFKVKNIGNITYNNIHIIFTCNSTINDVSIWNYEYEVKDKVLDISSASINMRPNSEINVSFILSTTNNNFTINKIKLDVDPVQSEPEIGTVLLEFIKSNSWGNFTIQYNVKVTNNTNKRITAWTIEIPLEENVRYISGWNALFNVNNNTLTIRNESYNAIIEVGKSATFGLQINAPVDNYIPKNYKINIR